MALTGSYQVLKRINDMQMGFELSKAGTNLVLEEFKNMSEDKKVLRRDDLRELIISTPGKERAMVFRVGIIFLV